MSFVDLKIATEEIKKWLDYKKISDKKRESQKDSIDSLIEAVSDGTLIVQEDHSFKQQLKFPIENKNGEITVSEFVYQPRIRVGSVQHHLQGIKSSDADGRINAYICALTSQPKEVVKNLDTEDYSIAQSISVFFL